MSSLLIFTKKELYEQVKTFRGVAIAAVLLVFGMTSPLLAKMMPDLIQKMDVGMDIKVPEPVYLDAYMQFFKNISNLGLIVLMLVFAGTIVSETTRGTAVLMLTKRLSHTAFVLSKFLSATVVWTVSYAASVALCFAYTVYLFPKGDPKNLFLGLFCMWLFGEILLAAAVFASAVFKSYIPAAVGTFGVWGLLLLSAALPKIKDHSPVFLASANAQLVSGAYAPDKAVIPIVWGVILITALLCLACLIFKRREL